MSTQGSGNDGGAAGAGGGTGAAGAGGGAPPPKTVAYENFRAVVTAKEGLESQVNELKRENQALQEKTASVDTLAGKLRETEERLTGAEAKYQTFVELSGVLGTTDADVISVFDQKYSALPKDKRPSRAEWVTGLRAAPDTAPTLLQPWLAPAAQPKAGAAGGGNSGPPLRTPGGTGRPAGAPAPSGDEIRAIREEAVRTGDWSKWKAYRERK